MQNIDEFNSSFPYFNFFYSYIGWNICNWFTQSYHSKFKKPDGYFLIAKAGLLMYLHIENEGSKIFILLEFPSLILQLNWKFV